jgi:hypothetical protein
MLKTLPGTAMPVSVENYIIGETDAPLITFRCNLALLSLNNLGKRSTSSIARQDSNLEPTD